MKYPEYNYVEGAYSSSSDNVPFSRHISILVTDQPSCLDSFMNAHALQMLYTSIYRYNDIHATIDKKWSGAAIGDFAMDIDSRTEFSDAHLFTVKMLREMQSLIPWKYVDCYFSGSKGFHIQVPFEVFGATPSNRIHLYYKYMARILAEAVTGAPLAKGTVQPDMGRFSLRQLWRVPNSFHMKSGLYKIKLLPKEVIELPSHKILQLARRPREKEISQYERSTLDRIEAAEALYQKAMQFVEGLRWWFQRN